MDWILRGSQYHDLSALRDRFLVGRYNVCIRSGSLSVRAIESGEDDSKQASLLANRYADVLISVGIPIFGLMTIEEFASGPAESVTVIGATDQHRKQLSRALRRARAELLESADQHLRTAYDYLQDAREDENHFSFHLYKFVETLESKYGASESNLIKALDANTEVKFIKRLANEPVNDERHAPKVPGEGQSVSLEIRRKAIEYANRIMIAYERHLLASS